MIEPTIGRVAERDLRRVVADLREVKEQSAEHRRLGQPVEHGVEDGAELRDGARLAGERAVEQVERAEDQHDDAGGDEHAARRERAGRDVSGESERRRSCSA